MLEIHKMWSCISWSMLNSVLKSPIMYHFILQSGIRLFAWFSKHCVCNIEIDYKQIACLHVQFSMLFKHFSSNSWANFLGAVSSIILCTSNSTLWQYVLRFSSIFEFTSYLLLLHKKDFLTSEANKSLSVAYTIKLQITKSHA